MKRALCVEARAVGHLFPPGEICQAVVIPDGFFETVQRNTELVDRAECETDESLLQFIPYVMVKNSKGRTLAYYRGGAGDEARLHSKISIGFGGHVDDYPGIDQTLLEWLQAEGARELLEEVGVAIDKPLEFTHLLYDNTNPVGRVHLGIVATFVIPDTAAPTFEKGIIEKSTWLEPVEVFDNENYLRMENWSKVVADLLVDNPNQCAKAPALHDLTTGKPSKVTVDEDLGRLMVRALRLIEFGHNGPSLQVSDKVAHEMYAALEPEDLLRKLRAYCELNHSTFIAYPDLVESRFESEGSMVMDLFKARVSIADASDRLYPTCGNTTPPTPEDAKFIMEQFGDIVFNMQKVMNLFNWSWDEIKLANRLKE